MCSCRSSTQTPEEAAQRTEELELAASVASRRAAAAEAELHRVKQLLDLTEKRAKELAWQVCALLFRVSINEGWVSCMARSGIAVCICQAFRPGTQPACTTHCSILAL